jgi:aminopeptidase N
LAHEYAEGTVSSNEKNGPVTIARQNLETAFAKNAKLDGVAETTVVATRDGVRVVPFDLFPTLRVQWVTGPNGEPLSFIQEGVEEDANFAVILPKELHKGESYTITTSYAGKNAVVDEGNKNYYALARVNWYPSVGFSGHSDYEMIFHIPKGLKMVATGELLKSTDADQENITEWKSYAAQPVAGFNFGEFKSMEAPDLSNHYMVETDVNEMSMSGRGPSYVPMMKKATAEGELAMDLYTDYFGEEPFKRIAMTQQQASSFGQSWPGLVFLPLPYFLDSTYRHMSGGRYEYQYFDTVGPHEIAHQWWGQMVGFNSYRDQWMSEGFAEMSAALFLQGVYSEHGLHDFHEFWAYRRKLLTDTNSEGKKPIDVGPVTMGYRLATAKTGVNVPFDLIYPKGAYILHMFRCMMQDSTTKDATGKPDVDARFKSMMHDFTRTYAGQTASTEDFKTMAEKHMTPEMDLMHNHRLDWFFNGYVYGTEYPSYHFEHSFSQESDGTLTLNLKLTQSHVSDDFAMLIPIYVELEKGQVARLGRIPIKGNTTVEKHVRMPNLGQKPRRAMIAYLDDVLGNVENK